MTENIRTEPEADDHLTPDQGGRAIIDPNPDLDYLFADHRKRQRRHELAWKIARGAAAVAVASTVAVVGVSNPGDIRTRAAQEIGLSQVQPPPEASVGPELPISPEAAAPKNNLLLIGDSLFARKRKLYESELEKNRWKVEIVAQSGNTIEDSLKDLEKYYYNHPDLRPDEVVVDLGTNNIGQTQTAIEEDIQALVSEIKFINFDAKIQWINAYKADSAGKVNRAENVNKVITGMSAELGFSVDDWATNAMNGIETGEYKFEPDGIHPSDQASWFRRVKYVAGKLGLAPKSKTKTDGSKLTKTPQKNP